MYDNLTRTELEFAYREAEKRIAELEDERSDLDMIAKNYAIKIANLKKSCDETQELLDKQIEATYKLDKENAELKEELTKKADTNHSLVEQMADLEKENAELKHTIATLRQEKDNVSMHTKAMEVVAKTRSDNLTKAKELLRYYFDCFKNDNKYTLSDFEVVEDTEQFLSEVEK